MNTNGSLRRHNDLAMQRVHVAVVLKWGPAEPVPLEELDMAAAGALLLQPFLVGPAHPLLETGTGQRSAWLPVKIWLPLFPCCMATAIVLTLPHHCQIKAFMARIYMQITGNYERVNEAHEGTLPQVSPLCVPGASG